MCYSFIFKCLDQIFGANLGGNVKLPNFCGHLSRYRTAAPARVVIHTLASSCIDARIIATEIRLSL